MTNAGLNGWPSTAASPPQLDLRYAPLAGLSGLSSGESTIPRELTSSPNITLTTQQLLLAYFTATKTEVVGNVRLVCGGTAAAATPTLIRVGIYSVGSNGDIALIASTANDTSLLASTSTTYTKALQGTFLKAAGTRYAVGVLVVSATTMPKLAGSFAAGGIGAELATAPRLTAQINSQSDLPATVANGSLTPNGSLHYTVLTP